MNFEASYDYNVKNSPDFWTVATKQQTDDLWAIRERRYSAEAETAGNKGLAEAGEIFLQVKKTSASHYYTQKALKEIRQQT